jgi:hypothetical protein
MAGGIPISAGDAVRLGEKNMERVYFDLNENESIEFQLDDKFDIVYMSPHGYIAISLDAVHIRAFLRCMTDALPELEAMERLLDDGRLINGPGNLRDKPMPR